MDTLKTRDLVKKYRKKAVVNKVSLNVSQGEIVALLGPNGAGKTTTFKMVVGLLNADGGEIFFGGEEISHMPMYKRARMGIGYLPQEPTVFARLTVMQNLEIVLENMRLSRKERKRKAQELLEEMQLWELRKSKAGRLSGGERRRLEVTRTLAISPKLIMLDEPFAAIDPKLVEGLQKVILHLKDRNIGVLITDHKPRETLSISNRGYVINKGEILREGSPDEIDKDPEVRKCYLGDKFTLE